MPETPSAAFASRSARFRNGGPMFGPVPGDYDMQYGTIAAESARAAQKSTPRRSSFGGTSSRTSLPWQSSANGDLPSQRGVSSDDAPVPSLFASSSYKATTRSAAFSGSGDRFATRAEATPGPGAYTTADKKPLSPSNRLNRSSSFGGRSKRFGVFGPAETPGPGQFDAKPGAFASASKKSSQAFGSRSARKSPFESTQKEDAPPPGFYQQMDASGTRDRTVPSAAFANKSSRFRHGADLGQTGADPGTYDSMDYHSMARTAAKSFNKASQRGSNGFGTSARRPTDFGKKGDVDSPGPAAYRGGDAPSSARERPSAAFASRSKQGGAHFKTDTPNGNEYNPHLSSSLAASASKTFNRKAGTNQFGPRAQRSVLAPERVTADTPGPGFYGGDEQPVASRGQHASAWAASTSARTPTWYAPPDHGSGD